MRPRTSAARGRGAACVARLRASSSASGSRSIAARWPALTRRDTPCPSADCGDGGRTASTTNTGCPVTDRCSMTSTSASSIRCASSTCNMTQPPADAASSSRRKAPITWWRPSGPCRAAAGAASGLSSASTDRAGPPTASSTARFSRIRRSATAPITAYGRSGCAASTVTTVQARVSRQRTELPAEGGLADAGRAAHHEATGPLPRLGTQPHGNLRQFHLPADERRPRRLQPGNAQLIQGLGLAIRGHAEHLLQAGAQARIPADRGGPVAGLELAFHQFPMRRLVRRLGLHQAFPLAAHAQQLEVARPQMGAGRFRPGLVLRPRQEFTVVGACRFGAGRGLAHGQRGIRPSLEDGRVHDHGPAGTKDDLPAAQQHRVLVAHGLPRVVRGLAQVGGASLGIELRPERIDDLLTQQLVRLRQAQQLNQVGRAQARPTVGRNLHAAQRHREPAEHADVDPVG